MQECAKKSINDIVCIDIETTGLDKRNDSIIQLSAIKLDKDTLQEIDVFNYYVIPPRNFHICKSATEVNGLTDEYIREHGVPALGCFEQFLKFIDGCDYLTFNGNSFDIEFIVREMHDLGLKFPIENKTFYDSKLIETRIHSNRLIACFERYTGKTMEESGLNPHDSLSDVRATAAVFAAQKEVLGTSLEEMSTWDENKMWSPEGSIKNAAHTGQAQLLVFRNGKYKDKDIFTVLQSDPQYLKWWSDNVATAYTRELVRGYLINKKQKEAQ